jgi:acetyltransferase-like isoleucine patch superfamily enzyme
LNPLAWAKSYIRGVILRKKFPTSVIYAGASIDQSSVLGEYSVLFQNVSLMDSTLGAYSYVQSGGVVYNVEIGKFCSIASNVTIGLGAHPLRMVSTSPVFYDNTQPLPKFFVNDQIFAETLPRTIIGADVWIGQGAMIKAGVTIGVGAVIGAGSIVTKDIAPYVVAAGNPCRQIRPRFTEDITRQLLLSKWWELKDDQLRKLAPAFADVDIFLTTLNTA